MTELTVSEARAHLADVVDEARVKHKPVFLTRRGRRVAAVIDAEDLNHLLELAEDAADLRSATVARDESQVEGTIPWEEIKTELGLT